jgi:hypothetical protein
MLKLIFITFIGVLFLTIGCTIEKRVHQKGFHITRKSPNIFLVNQPTDSVFTVHSEFITEEDFSTNLSMETTNYNLQTDTQLEDKNNSIIPLYTPEKVKKYITIGDTTKVNTKKLVTEPIKKKEPVGQIALALIIGLFFTAGKLFSLFTFLPAIFFLIIILLLIIHRIRIKKFPEKYKIPNKVEKPQKIQQKEVIQITDDIIAKPLLLIGLIALVLGLILTFAIFIFGILALPFFIVSGSLVLLSFLLIYIHKIINRHTTYNPTFFTLISFLAVIFWLLFITKSGFIILILIPLIGIFLLPRLITKLYD